MPVVCKCCHHGKPKSAFHANEWKKKKRGKNPTCRECKSKTTSKNIGERRDASGSRLPFMPPFLVRMLPLNLQLLATIREGSVEKIETLLKAKADPNTITQCERRFIVLWVAGCVIMGS